MYTANTAITQKMIINATESYSDMIDLSRNRYLYKHIEMIAKIKSIYFNSSASKKKSAISRSKNKGYPRM